MMGEMKMREKQGSSGAKTRIHVICAIVALLCVAVMFVPAGRERGRGSQYGEVLLLGEMQFATSHATSGFDSDQPIYKIAAFALIVAAALLIGWAVRSFQGKSSGLGLIAAIVNLSASAFVLMIMAVENGTYLLIIPVVVLIALLTIAALVLAIRQRHA